METSCRVMHGAGEKKVLQISYYDMTRGDDMMINDTETGSLTRVRTFIYKQ